jgi:hypothetical protein
MNSDPFAFCKAEQQVLFTRIDVGLQYPGLIAEAVWKRERREFELEEMFATKFIINSGK